MEWIFSVAGIYLLFINIFSFSLFGIDKNKAVRNAYRIPERTLFLTAAVGGSLGSLLGMYLFRHKTRHTSFRIGVPALLILHILVGFLLLRLSAL